MPHAPRRNTARPVGRRWSLDTRGPCGRVTLEELRGVLAEEGYSADRRKASLKQMLTEISCPSPPSPIDGRETLVREVKNIIDQYQDGESMAGRTL